MLHVTAVVLARICVQQVAACQMAFAAAQRDETAQATNLGRHQSQTQAFGGQVLRAIQSTTAAGLAECARMLLTEDLCGPLLQSGLDSEDYLNGPYVSAVYKKPLSLTTL